MKYGLEDPNYSTVRPWWLRSPRVHAAKRSSVRMSVTNKRAFTSTSFNEAFASRPEAWTSGQAR